MSTRLDESSEGRKVRLKYVKWQTEKLWYIVSN